jgi:hypothetical protein
MMKLVKSIATVSTALTFALCLAGGAHAQSNSNPPAHKPAPQNTTVKAASPVSAKPTTAAPIANRPAAMANAKPVAAKPAAGKPIAAKSVALKPAAPKPVPAKLVATKPALAKPAAEAAKTEKPVGTTASADEAPSAAPSDTLVAKRDPFVALVNEHKEGGGGPALPPGKAGLVVATVHVDGTVRSGDELIAVVSNPEKHVYFIREGDQLYDGNVKKIDLEGVTFQENSKDAFGKPVEREVTKRIYASAGEQQ